MSKRIQGNYNYGPKTESWKQWLDQKEDRSVVYVPLGSLSKLSDNQMAEVAYGLMDSKCNFLWVVRDSERQKLPKGFGIEAMKNGLVVNWCVQLQVLGHRAVGCFLTYCGWNSTLEALVMGIPMVTVPESGDQTTNAKLIVDVWKVGVGGKMARKQVAGGVKEVLGGKRGDEMKECVEMEGIRH